MSNFCKDCRFSKNVHDYTYSKCLHPRNYSQPSEITGEIVLMRDLYDFRYKACNGNLFEPKPIKKSWWKFWRYYGVNAV